MSTHVRLSDESTWPLPDLDEVGLSWRLTYGTPSREDLLRAVSIIRAYGYLLTETNQQRRAMVVREIRAALTTPRADHNPLAADDAARAAGGAA